MPASGVERFRTAQDAPVNGFAAALEEMRRGAKVGHWIWYVFPQLEGLGGSELSRSFALRGVEEAAEFLRDPELRSRLLTITRVVAAQLSTGRAASLPALMGSEIDALKVVSSLTLFRSVARNLHDKEGTEAYDAVARAAEDVLAVAASHGYPPCAYTLQRLRGLT